MRQATPEETLIEFIAPCSIQFLLENKQSFLHFLDRASCQDIRNHFPFASECIREIMLAVLNNNAKSIENTLWKDISKKYKNIVYILIFLSNKIAHFVYNVLNIAQYRPTAAKGTQGKICCCVTAFARSLFFCLIATSINSVQKTKTQFM